MKLRVSSILPLNSVLRSMSNKMYSQVTITKITPKKPKVSDEDIIRIRWLREVSGITSKEICAMFPHINKSYIMQILCYTVRSSVGIDSQFKQPHVSEVGTNGSCRKRVEI